MLRNVKATYLLVPIISAFGFTATSLGQAIVPPFHNYQSSLGGVTTDYIWESFSSENRPAGVGAGTGGMASQWLAGLAPTQGAAGPVFSGNPSNGSDYTDFVTTANGGGIYAFFTQTHFQISSSTPVAGLQTLTMQLYVVEGLTGAFGGTTAILASDPVLSLTTSAGTFIINPTYISTSSHDSAVVNGSSSFLDMLNYQWDLSSVAGTPESYTLNWQTSYHSITFGEDVTESTAPNPSSVLAVPEPSTSVAILGGFGVLAMFRRRWTAPQAI